MWCEEVAFAQSTWSPMNDVVLMPGFAPPVVVTLTNDWLVVDLRVPAKMGLTKRSVRTFDIPVTQIANVEVEGWSAERPEFGWR